MPEIQKIPDGGTHPAHSSPCIVVAGASGYIGMAIMPRLLERFPGATITALARTKQETSDPRITWRSCDLFSLRSLEAALPSKVDLAIYLVHSMGPTAHLDQGSFADYDLILADNFARAITKTGVQQLIYLSGLIPQTEKLSRHLSSRLEVENTFSSYGLPLTVFRAGLILGEDGSSFQILLKLVKRLPFMICPHWTQTLTAPVDLPTVLSSITSASLLPEHLGKIYDLTSCRPLTYVQMMRETARKLGTKRRFIPVPFFTPTLSRLWVSLITNTPKNLVYPLIESLEHPMVAREDHLYSRESSDVTYFDLLEHVSLQVKPGRKLFRFKANSRKVRSIQRLPLPDGRDAAWVMHEYLSWLPRYLSPLIKVNVDRGQVRFSVFAKRPVLLEMQVSEERSSDDRVLLYITKGWLASRADHGRLEFRVTKDRKIALAAIHNFTPSLPWYVYTLTQARLHLFVMNAFGRHLARQAKGKPSGSI
jgi:uncharacterized protein YbjT (DUF2867 family)